MLGKWKEEKELKKKLAAREKFSKQPFKVVHLQAEMIPFSKPAKVLPKVSLTEAQKVFENCVHEAYTQL